MKYLYSFIIALVIFSVSTEAYYCITALSTSHLPVGVLPRVVYYFSFFTVLSSIALAVGCLFTILNPNYHSQVMVVLRLDGVISVIVTGVVYNIMLRAIHHPDLLILKITNECLHVVIPILGVVGWWIFDPHGRVTKSSILYAVIPPIIYVIYIFIRGAIVGLYPYPLLNVSHIGYLRAFINTGIISIVFIVLAMLLYFVDQYYGAEHQPSV